MSKKYAVKSKIPIPVDPLPRLSENALRNTQVLKTGHLPRQPLETLYQEPVNLERAEENRKVKKVLRRSYSLMTKLDTRHVTVRQKSEHYNVFNDNVQDDDINKDTLTRTNTDARVEERGKVSTPVPKTLLEPSRIRNIKRSLKRPHSRELIGISPGVSDDKGDEKHKRKLDFTSRFDQPTDLCISGLNSYATSYTTDYGADLFKYLLRREIIPETPRISNTQRACIINWLVKVNGPTRSPAAVQTAAWFFDSVLAVGQVQVDKLQVLAAACYWIARKIQGQPGSATKLVSIGANAYSAKLLLSAEKAVLAKLPIVAQEFISYLSWVCDASNFAESEAAATLLYMAGLVAHKGLVSHYPSVLAAAAVSNALSLLRRKHSLAKLQENDVYKVAAKKVHNFVDICWLQREAICTMGSPDYKYKALLINESDCNRILTEKILTSINNKKIK